jgi:hypothetical protein
MDKIRISGVDLRDFYQPAQKLSQVFQEIENELAAKNQIICRLIVNAHVLNEAEESFESEFGNMPLEMVESFEYWTDHAKQLAPNIIRSWKKLLPELIANCDDLAARIRFDGAHEQMPRVERLVENCQYLVESLVLLRQSLGDTALAQYTDWAVAQEQMEHLLHEALVAIEKKDFQLLADVLEFDFAHNLGQWIKFLDFAEKQLSI